MLCRRRWGLGLPMKNGMIVARIALSRKSGGQNQQSKRDSVRRGVRMRHKEMNDLQPTLILGQYEDHWEEPS